MFHQMLYFLSLKEEVASQAQEHFVRQQVDNNSKTQSPNRAFFSSLLSDEEV
jgi:hypothetical protein